MIPQPIWQLKLVLVGESSVGKSSILSRFVDDQFNQSQLLTIGVDFKFRKIKVDNEGVKLQIWDTAGKQDILVQDNKNLDRFLVLTIIVLMELLLYMILPRIVVFKYEILYTKSIKDYWIEEAKNNNKNNASIFIIGNKLDEAQNKREVEAHNVELLLENNPVDKHFEVSAKSGQNIEQTFTEICRLMITKKKAEKVSQGQIHQQKLGQQS